MHKLIVFLVFSVLMNNVMGQKKDKVIYIKNEQLKVGVLPEVGGRIVYLSRPSQKNILKSDSSLWNEPKSERIKPSAYADFKAYNGHITWVGPQSDWWVNQNINSERKAAKSVWPPDPYLIYGNFKIMEQTDTSIVCIGPKSPISGVQLTKKYSLSGNNLHIEVSAKNIRKVSVGIDLWSNARFNGYTRFVVPLDENEILKIDSESTGLKDALRYSLENNNFTFIAEAPSENKIERTGKAYLNPSNGKMIAYVDNNLLVIEFIKVAADKIHPNQAFVEVFNSITKEKEESLLELEHHSAYKNLMPGEEMLLQETWTLYNYNDERELETDTK